MFPLRLANINEGIFILRNIMYMISSARNKYMVFIFVPFCWNLFTKCVCSQLVTSPCYNSLWFIFWTKIALIKKISRYNGHLFYPTTTTTSWRRKHQPLSWMSKFRYIFDWMNKLLLNTYKLSYRGIRMINVHATFKYLVIV